MNRWLFLWRRWREALWFTVGLYALFGVAVALAAGLAAPLVSDDIGERFGKTEAVENLLTILASSLLAVATFSLGAMVTAYTAAGSAATPRVTGIVVSDPRTRKALATFVGGFLFAIVALVALSAAYYGAGGRAILYFGTLGMIVLVAWSLLRWIDHLGRLARMGYVLERVEAVAENAIQDRIEEPRLGGAPVIARETASFTRPVASDRTGHVQNIDTAALQDLAEEAGCEIELCVLPGAFLVEGEAMALTRGGRCDEAFDAAVCEAFSIGRERTFDRDPRMGMVVLGEIAARALSPAVNDPGTAIAVVGATVRLMSHWGRADWDDCPVRHPRVRVPTLVAADMIDDALGPVARYGAGDLAASVRLQKGLARLKASSDRELSQAATAFAKLAFARSKAAMPMAADAARVRAALDAEPSVVS